MTVPVTLYDQLCAVILEALTGHAPDKVTPPACLRVDIFEEEPRWPYPGLIIGALCIIGWAAFAGMAYCLYQLVEVIAG